MQESKDQMSFKDGAVLLPLVASTFAISWEVGRFFPFGGFRLFTLSEHLLSAASYLPVALTSTAAVAFYFSLAARVTHGGGKRGSVIFTIVCFAIYISACFVAHIYFGASWPSIGVYIVFCLVFLMVFLIVIIFERPFTNVSGVTAIFAFGIVSSLMFAAASSYVWAEQAQSDPTALTDIHLKTGIKKALLIMVGERGVLFFDPTSKRTTLARLDDLQGLEWDAP